MAGPTVTGLTIAGHKIKPGETYRIEMPVAKLYTDTDINMPVHVIRAKKPGPKVFVCAAIHGDELNGIEVVRRLIQSKTLKLVKGSLILVSMVNVYGVLNHSRYMPDRRDLNRCFPGSPKGSLAGRVADKFIEEIVRHCDYGIDLHTGALHRSNLPQVRANLGDPEILELAEVFGAPVLINSNLRDGSLRQTAADYDCKVLLYEAGQALRFDELSIRLGVRGVRGILAHLGMVKKRQPKISLKPFVANSSAWMRANASGILHSLKNLGDYVNKGTPLASIGDPFGEILGTLVANRSGIIIGKQNIPLAQEGDALFHIASFMEEEEEELLENLEVMQENLAV